MPVMDKIFRPELGSLFGFSEEDLNENRAGKLASAQIGRLRSQAILRGMAVVLGMSLIGIMALASADSDPDGTTMFLLFLGVPIIVALALTIGVTELTIAPGMVDKRTGQIHLRSMPMPYQPPLDETIWLNRHPHSPGLHSMIIQDQEFRLTEAQYNGLEYATYTVYFLPRLQRIMSIEPITINEPSERLLPPPPDVTLSNNTRYIDEGDNIRG